MKKYFMILACAAMAICSCTKNPDDGPVVKDIFSVDAAPVEVGCDVTSAKIAVSSNIDWTASVSEGAELSVSSGNGDAEIVVSFPANDGFDGKTFTVTVTAAKEEYEGQKSYSVEIRQAGKTRTLSVKSPDAVAWDVQSAVVVVNSNIAWKASVSGDVQISVTEGTGDGEITVSFPCNITNETKTYTVTVTPDDQNWTGEEKFEAVVSQNASATPLEFATDEIVLSEVVANPDNSSSVYVTGDPYSSKGGAFTLTFGQGTNSNMPKYYKTDTHVRVYSGNIVTIASDKLITKIEFTTTSGYSLGASSSAKADSGAVVDNTWNGTARKVVFSKHESNTAQFRVQKAVVTYVK